MRKALVYRCYHVPVLVEGDGGYCAGPTTGDVESIRENSRFWGQDVFSPVRDGGMLFHVDVTAY